MKPTTGRIIETKEATDQLIVSLQKEAETAALQELLVQAYKDRYQAVADAEEAVKKIDAAEQALMKTEQELTDTSWWDFQKHAELTAQQEKQTEALKAANEARNNAITAYDELSGAINTYSGALTDLKEPESSVGVQLESRMDSVRKTVEGVAADMPGYGRNIGEGLEKGMDEGIKEKTTKSLFGQLGTWFTELFGIHSPSTVFSDYGAFLVQGLYNGMDENIPSVSTLLENFLGDTKTSTSNAWNDIATETSNKWYGIRTDLSNKISGIDDDTRIGFKTIKDTIVGKIDETMSDLDLKDWKSIGSNIVDGILDGLGGIFRDLTRWASDVWDSITGSFSGGKAKSSIRSGVQSNSGRSYESIMQEIPASFSARSLPRLANGAVIPPNQQFAAILGDQRSGKNLEAPAGLIRQMVAEGMQTAMAQGGGFGRGGNMTVIMEIDGREFGRASYKYGTAESQRVGVRLVEVGT